MKCQGMEEQQNGQYPFSKFMTSVDLIMFKINLRESMAAMTNYDF